MEKTITLDTQTLTSKINTNNFLLLSCSQLILIGYIGMTILFGIYMAQNETIYDDLILYVIFGFMAIISFGVGYSYYFLKQVIKDTLTLIKTSKIKDGNNG